jgi:thymidylate synthase ThyX
MILAEMNTHRAFSRNSASSRAIPIEKMIKSVVDDPFVPVVFGRNEKGMSSSQFLSGDDEKRAIDVWLLARDAAVDHARILCDLGCHKQVANRLLEPFMWHTAIISSVEWDNFFDQRCSPAAEPHMERTANAMREAIRTSKPNVVKLGDFHLPYCSDHEIKTLLNVSLVQLSVARCARVSYLNHDGVRDLAADYALYEKLVSGDHWSPFEHVAYVATTATGNFSGSSWQQVRSMVERGICTK